MATVDMDGSRQDDSTININADILLFSSSSSSSPVLLSIFVQQSANANTETVKSKKGMCMTAVL